MWLLPPSCSASEDASFLDSVGIEDTRDLLPIVTSGSSAFPFPSTPDGVSFGIGDSAPDLLIFLSGRRLQLGHSRRCVCHRRRFCTVIDSGPLGPIDLRIPPT